MTTTAVYIFALLGSIIAPPLETDWGRLKAQLKQYRACAEQAKNVNDLQICRLKR